MPRRKGQDPLTEVHIIRAAIELVDKSGMENLSMRRLAAVFGVKPMALYYYFKDKEALIHAMINDVLSECDLRMKDNWEDSLWSFCSSLRAVARKHPAVFLAAMVYDKTVVADFAIAEAFLNALCAGGLEPGSAVRGYHTLLTFVTGFAVDEISGLLYTFAGEQEAFDALPSGAFPLVQDYRRILASADPDEGFEFGLSMLIGGIARGSAPEE